MMSRSIAFHKRMRLCRRHNLCNLGSCLTEQVFLLGNIYPSKMFQSLHLGSSNHQCKFCKFYRHLCTYQLGNQQARQFSKNFSLCQPSMFHKPQLQPKTIVHRHCRQFFDHCYRLTQEDTGNRKTGIPSSKNRERMSMHFHLRLQCCRNTYTVHRVSNFCLSQYCTFLEHRGQARRHYSSCLLSSCDMYRLLLASTSYLHSSEQRSWCISFQLGREDIWSDSHQVSSSQWGRIWRSLSLRGSTPLNCS